MPLRPLAAGQQARANPANRTANLANLGRRSGWSPAPWPIATVIHSGYAGPVTVWKTLMLSLFLRCLLLHLLPLQMTMLNTSR